MNARIDAALAEDIALVVERVLVEDLGDGDLTAGLLPADAAVEATVITRQPMVLAGGPWFEALFRRLDASIAVDWRHGDGDGVAADTVICTVSGPARPILSGERGALNLLQTLSATATTTARYVRAVAGTDCKILDTRKTLPGLRLAQKYAVRCGGGNNHRFGLYDAVLIKENHILAAGGVGAAVRSSRQANPGVDVEIEVESLAELELALAAGADRVMLDNFSHRELRAAVAMAQAGAAPKTKLEASGNVGLDTIGDIARTGVDFISVGALTKNVDAIDLSMRVDNQGDKT